MVGLRDCIMAHNTRSLDVQKWDGKRFEELWGVGDMTTIFIDIEKEIAPIVGSRDVVKAFERRMDTAKKIILDFKNVEFASRSAAHVLLEYKRNNPDKVIEFRNMNQSVEKMFYLVEAQLEGRANKDKLKSVGIEVMELVA
ncbi:hypothetical protein [Archaeoglobus neptunius]|uniref:hypothetical protein n=1 Tax=Archaeoglobus neptunius TaxID=2798580 RepID=UPI001926A9E4|nr:hypothetical protein [Archaeoglobus neptunius]